MDTKSRKAQDITAVDLFGPGLRTIQQRDVKTRHGNIIESDYNNLKDCVGGTLDKVYSDTGKYQSFSMLFDGTKPPAKLQLSTAFKAVVGGIYLSHVVDISETNEDDVRALLAKGSDVVQAVEVKACMLTL